MFSFGFYNSLNHDRKYSAQQFSTLIDCLITDGVFENVGGFFGTTPGSGLQVIVKPGLAWFNHTWNNNDASMPLNLSPADVTRTRYDAVVLEVNEANRTNSIKVLTGTPAVSPAKPALTNTDTLHQHVLAYVKVPGGATSIVASNIEVMVGKSACPFVTAILQTTNIDLMFANWNDQFNTWFENLKLQLTDDVVANLQRQIDELVEGAHKVLSGTTVPASTLGEDGDTYVKTR